VSQRYAAGTWLITQLILDNGQEVNTRWRE